MEESRSGQSLFCEAILARLEGLLQMFEMGWGYPALPPYWSHFLEWEDVAQAVEHSAVKVWILLHGGSILHGGCICSLGYFLFQPVVHNWSIKGCGMCCPVCGKVHIKDPLLLIGKSSLCGNSGFHLKKYVTMTICLISNSWWYENQCAPEAWLNKANFPLLSWHFVLAVDCLRQSEQCRGVLTVLFALFVIVLYPSNI